MYFEMDDAYETGAGRGIDTDLRVAIDPTACPVQAPRPRARASGASVQNSRTAHTSQDQRANCLRVPRVCHVCSAAAAVKRHVNRCKIQADIG